MELNGVANAIMVLEMDEEIKNYKSVKWALKQLYLFLDYYVIYQRRHMPWHQFLNARKMRELEYKNDKDKQARRFVRTSKKV